MERIIKTKTINVTVTFPAGYGLVYRTNNYTSEYEYIKHVGGDGGGACYQTPYEDCAYGSHSLVEKWDTVWKGHYRQCTRCGNTWYETTPGDTCYSNRIKVTKYKLSRIKEETDTWTTKDASSLDQGDYIISALVEYN